MISVQFNIIEQFTLNLKSMPQPLCPRRWSWTGLWEPIRPSRTNTKKDVIFTIGDRNAKVGKQEISGVAGKLGLVVQNEAWQKLTEFLPKEHPHHYKHPLTATQELKIFMDITRLSTLKSDWLYSLQPKMEKLYTISKNKTRIWLWLRSHIPYFKIQF